jgi:hypothetical protein
MLHVMIPWYGWKTCHAACDFRQLSLWSVIAYLAGLAGRLLPMRRGISLIQSADVEANDSVLGEKMLHAWLGSALELPLFYLC